ncbi:cleavage and polyadenylation specificity factor subunit 2 [Enteropsectra breve]|nr:cleavage and polyadenylation specificity factor subunit 2 [Enteropsectra breve]
MKTREVKYTPLFPPEEGVHCHLLQIGTAKIVINCGIGKELCFKKYDRVKDIINSADCILITSFAQECIGALWMFPNKKIYCSLPTAVFGKMALNSIREYLHTYKGKDIDVSLDITSLKYSQIVRIGGIAFSPHNAGYCIGNSIFKIMWDTHTLLVGFNVNHRRENYINGANFTNYSKIWGLVTNDVYTSMSQASLKARDSTLLDAINSTEGKVVINVPLSRLLELLHIITDIKILIICPFAQAFLERAKGMVEWTAQQSSELLSSSNIGFGMKENIADQKVIILIDENEKHGFLGSILEHLNAPENLYLRIDAKTEFNPDRVNIYKHAVKITENKPNTSTKSFEKLYEYEGLDDCDHWCGSKNAVFYVKKYLNPKDVFPCIRKKRRNNDYGEKIKFVFSSSNAASEKTENEYVVNERIAASLTAKGISLDCGVLDFNLGGCSDVSSLMSGLDEMHLQELLFVPSSASSAVFCKTYFKKAVNIKNIGICSEERCFVLPCGPQKVMISESVMEQESSIIKGKAVKKCLVQKREECIEYVGEGTSVPIGCFQREFFIKSLVDDGFTVKEDKENEIEISEKARIIEKESSICIYTSDDGMLLEIINSLTKHIMLL